MPTPAQVREHYEVEKEIASRLRDSHADQRRTLYSEAYDELFRRVPHHPMLAAKTSGKVDAAARREIALLEGLTSGDSVYLEIGPGDCSIAKEMARRVEKVYAVDVSSEITSGLDLPANFELLISDGTSIPVVPESVDVVYSNQLMEHLHPEDAEAQLANVFRSLKPGGYYYCVTPNRLSGPHDISRNFDDEATGLHLKEYTVGELDRLFGNAGFRNRMIYLGYGKVGIFIPTLFHRSVESVIKLFPHRLRRALTFNRVARLFLGIRMLARK